MNKIQRKIFVFIVLFLFLPLFSFAADGSGTNSVSPTSVNAGSTGNILNFTFTAAETMDSGGVTITIPSGWTAPQGIAGTAGYTTLTSDGLIANVEDNADSITNWAAQSGACNAGFSLDTTTFHEGTGSILCQNSSAINNKKFYKNITSEDWSGYTNVAFWIRTSANLNSSQLKFQYAANANIGTPIESINLPAITANTWTYVVLGFGATTRTAVISFGFQIAGASAQINNINLDDFLLGPGVPSFPGGGIISVRVLQLASAQAINVTYGSGGGTSGATAPSAGETSTFTTQSRSSDSGTLTNIASSPTVAVNNPTLTVTSISPSSAAAGGGAFTLTVNGTNFNSSSVVQWNGSSRTTAFVSSTQITAQITAADIASVGMFSVTVVNPPPGGGISNSQTFTVTAPAGGGTQAVSSVISLAGGAGQSRAIFRGQAYPYSTIVVLRRLVTLPEYEGASIANSIIRDDGTFEITLEYFQQADWLFALQAKDKEGRNSRLVAFSQFVQGGSVFKVENILISPTINVKESVIAKGKSLSVFGYAAPNTAVEAFIDGKKMSEAKSGSDGRYSIFVSADSWEIGDYFVKTRYVLSDGRTSDFSDSKAFKVSPLEFPKSDLDNDGKVDISDWSVFLFRWGTKDAALKTTIDLNNDGKIDIADFSVFLQSFKLQ